MTQPNPFAPEQSAPSRFLRQLPALPRYLVGVILLVSVIGMLITLPGWLANDAISDLRFWLRYVAMYWVTYLLMAGLGVYWLANTYMERHSLISYRQPAVLLVGYGLLCLLLSRGLDIASGQLYVWLYSNSDVSGVGRLLTDFGWWCLGLLLFCLEVLLPLWLLLHLLRRKAEVGAGTWQVPGAILAWCFALAIMVAALQLAGLTIQLANGMFYDYEVQGWESLIQAVLYLLVALFAARSALPAQVRGFNGGRLALAVSITLALWIGSAVLCAMFMLALLWLGLGSNPALLVLFGLLQLALLWPFTRLGLRWGYRVQAV